MKAEHIIFFLLDVSRFPLELLGIYLCVILFRRNRQWGWLLLSGVFLTTFFNLGVNMLLHDQPFPLRYKKVSYEEGLMVQSISYRIPVWQLFAVSGLFLIAREKQKSSA
jgi:hypothetical protein